MEHISTPPHPNHILLLAQELSQGGSERQLAATALGLDRRCYHAHVGTLRPGGFRLEELQQAGLRSTCFPLASFAGPGVIRAGWQLRKYVKDSGIALVHSFDTPGNAVTVAVYGAARIVTSQRAHRELSPAWMQPWLRLTDRIADRVVVNCRAVERHLIEDEGVAPGKIRLCYNGIDLERFHPGGRPRHPALWGTALTIGVVCALRPEKDLITLAEGFAMAWREHPEMRLVIVGSGSERPGLETKLAALGLGQVAHLEPATADVTPWLRGIDIFVLPSRSEALSNALMEAMACGCTGVASAVGGNPELVRDGETGLLFPAGDAEKLAKCLVRLAREEGLRREMAKRARMRIESEFSLPTAARRMQEIYAELLD